MNAWTKYPHLVSTTNPTLHPLTPRHIAGAYEKGRWARTMSVAMKDCPYWGMPGWEQEWATGWLDEDDCVMAAKTIVDSDFVVW